MAANIIDSFLVSLGFKTDTSGLRAFRQQTESVKDSILELGSVIASVAAGAFAIKKAVDISSEFEQNQIAIAGFLSSLGLSGDFKAGLSDAAAIMQQITLDAAKLPGEAEEYIEVFRAGLPELKAAMPGASAVDMAKFTNTITALGKTLKIDAPQIGRDLKLLLGTQGRAGGHVKTFQDLLSFMRLVPGQANLTSASFNAMSQQARAALLQQTFQIQGLQDMLGASANSFDAMWGALKSTVTQLTRLGSAGLFEGIKDSLAEINALFFTTDGKLTETGKDVIDILKQVSGVVGAMLRDGVQLVGWIASMTKHSQAFRVVLVAIGAYMASGTLLKTVSIVSKIAGGFKLASLAAGLFVVVLALLVEDMIAYYDGAETLIDWNSKIGTGLKILLGFIGLAGAAWLALKVKAVASAVATAASWAIALWPLTLAIAAIGLLIFGIVQLYSHWNDVLDFVQEGLNGWVDVLNQVIDKINTVLEAFGSKGIGKIGGFTFADESRNAAYGGKMGAGEGVLAPQYGPALPFSMTGSDVMGRGAGGVVPNGAVTSTENHIGTVNINGNDDPKKMGDQWFDMVRDAGTSKVGI